MLSLVLKCVLTRAKIRPLILHCPLRLYVASSIPANKHDRFY
uniref:Uncharacterized protein n=1 Tax=Arundo donax TaxID=35708 RepID=A0A0A8ZKJ5_ARUDO